MTYASEVPCRAEARSAVVAAEEFNTADAGCICIATIEFVGCVN